MWMAVKIVRVERYVTLTFGTKACTLTGESFEPY